MGNICMSGGSKPQKPQQPNSPGRTDTNDSNNNQYNGEEIDYSAVIKKMQEFHLDRLKTEVDSDPQTFTLDNLLMCIQFFDNFDKSVNLANDYRRSAEREMTDLLAKEPHEGMILGDRRVRLLTGMSYVLAQNFIYSGKSHSDDDVDEIYGGIGLKDTFLTEGILPLEFTMGWDNFELYQPDEAEVEKVYSDAKGASPSTRLCMEQPDKKTEFPKGYVRLRCLDEPISHRKQLEAPRRSSSDIGYATQEPIYHDLVPEAHSESDGTAPNSGNTSEDDDVSMKNLTGILKNLPSNGMSQPIFNKNPNLPSTSKAALLQAGTSRPNLPKLNMSHVRPDRNESFPSLLISAPTPPVLEGQLQSQSFENGFLHPRTKILSQQSVSTPNLTSLDRNSPAKDTLYSSGYDTTSEFSQSSSMLSELVRDKWQKQNLKKLWEYGNKSRKDQIPPGGKYDPVPADCYEEIQYQVKYDEPLEEEGDDLEDDNGTDDEEDDDVSDDIDFSTGRLIKKKPTIVEEDTYDTRFYLNSLKFSSNACSEFHHIGQTLCIPRESLLNGVVLGTSIRCPIPYAHPKERADEDEATVGNYYVTYSFTPALHGKWPTDLADGFRLQNTVIRRKVEGEIWPSQDQVDQIELAGCFAIPLGYRSWEFFNKEQFLEWELNFQNCEVDLLASLRSPQWRAYIFASILFRAFIAPLGPQGVGQEHIRNVLYCMCYQNFSGWNEEQPGVHLKTLLKHLLDCLSMANMPSFFVKSRNLFQSIPQHNIRFIQGNLKRICDNLIVYSIYSFRNLMNIRKDKTYPLPNFRRLYEIVTAQEGEILKIVNPVLRMQNDDEDAKQRELDRQRSRKKRKQRLDLIERQDEIERNFTTSQNQVLGVTRKRDKVKTKLERAYRRHEKQLQEQRRLDREAQRLQKDPELRVPKSEKRNSIDLNREPVSSRFSDLRNLSLIEFFVEHFMKMAKTAVKLQNYSQATMYVLQIENLCDVAKEIQAGRDVIPVFHQEDFDKYREETLELRGKIGSDMKQYIIDKISHPSSQKSHLTPARSFNELDGMSPSAMGFPTFTNNWDLRKLPTPPASEKDIRPTGKKLEKPNISSSLQSFDKFANSNTRVPPAEPSTSSAILSPRPPPAAPSDKSKVVRRQESLKFVSSPKTTPPPETPPRQTSRPPSRQSISLLELEVNEDEEGVADESTDL